MTIKKTKIKNFQSISEIELEFKDKINIITGGNRIGKTTILQALSWCLVGKTLENTSDVERFKNIKDTRLPVCVEIELNNGNTIMKVYKEIWVRKRGEEIETFDRNETTYFINGFELKAKEFEQQVCSLFGVKDLFTLQAMIIPTFLGDESSGDDWKKVRAFIVDICGDVENGEIFTSNPETKILKTYLDLAKNDLTLVKKKIKDGRKTQETVVKTLKEQLGSVKEISDTQLESLKQEKNELYARETAKELNEAYLFNERLHNIKKLQASKMDDLVKKNTESEKKIEHLRIKLENLPITLCPNCEHEIVDKNVGKLYETEILELQNSIRETNLKIETLESDMHNTNTTKEMNINDLEDKSKEERIKHQEIDEKIRELEFDIRMNEQVEKNKEKLIKEQKELLAFDKMDIAFEVFVREKLSLLQNKVASKFAPLTINLTKELINGNITETCEIRVMTSGAIFKKASKSERIITGKYLIDCIRRHYGLENLPILFDEGAELDSESLELINDTQVITVKVSEGKEITLC